MSDKHERDEGRIHPEIPRLADELAAGRLDRREFLRFATLLGLSAGAAYGLAGLRPAAADQAAPKRGGSMRISMRVPEPRHPHTFSWVYDSNLVRQVNDHLTRTGPDNVTRPWLLERWSASDDLKTWTLYLRPDVTWSNGEPLVAEQVVWNIRRWLDPDVGSSMLGLMKGYMLDDIESGRLDDAGQPILTTRLWDADAIEQLDDQLHLLESKWSFAGTLPAAHRHSNTVVTPSGHARRMCPGLELFTYACATPPGGQLLCRSPMRSPAASPIAEGHPPHRSATGRRKSCAPLSA